LHAADLFRVPGVGLFGPTDPYRWGFRLSPHGRSIWGMGMMEAISREAVLEALLEIAEHVQHEHSAAREESRSDDRRCGVSRTARR